MLLVWGVVILSRSLVCFGFWGSSYNLRFAPDFKYWQQLVIVTLWLDWDLRYLRLHLHVQQYLNDFQIFPAILGVVFSFLDGVLKSTFLIWGFQCIFYFIVPGFGAISKIPLPNPTSWKVTSTFFSKSLIGLALTVRLCSIVYKLLYMVWEKGLNSFFCMCVSSCLSHFCWKDDCFPAEWFWQAPWKAIDDRCADLYLGSEFYSIDLLSALVPISYFLGYSNFVVTVQVGMRESSNVVIFFP